MDRLQALRAEMREQGVDAYFVSVEDFHQSEYVSAYFKSLEYLSGFTGENGQLLVSAEGAWIFTDGRFFLQAEQEIAGRGIELMRSGMKGVPDWKDLLRRVLPEGGVLSVDGRCLSHRRAEEIRESLRGKHCRLETGLDLIGKLWLDRPALPRNPVWILEERWCGKAAKEKLAALREEMRKAGADAHILSSLTDIAWLLNLRGSDVLCTPVFLSYLLICPEEARLYAMPEAFAGQDGRILSYLEGMGIRLSAYEQIYADLRTIRNKAVLLDGARTNEALYASLDPSNTVLDRPLPTLRWKAIKNDTEIRNLEHTHVLDGIAMTKYIYFLKHAYDAGGRLTGWAREELGCDRLTEQSGAAYLLRLRQAQEGFLDLSFPTISAYGAHAALPHYAMPEDQETEIAPRGLYLVDSGGHYLFGTTDITRTVAMGPLREEEKRHYTRVLQGMLRLSDAVFLEGTSGIALDYTAREPLWREGLHYEHGTGHGVGYLLSVHEGPNAIRSREMPGSREDGGFSAGMLTSDEPGYYAAASHGIRIENLLLCRKAFENQYGVFLRFSFLTLCPIDTEAIEIPLLEERELALLNAYHRKVFEALRHAFRGESLEWLSEATRELC